MFFFFDQSESGDSGPGKTPSSPMGVAVSCMSPVDDVIADNEKNIFDWLKEDNQSQVTALLKSNNVDAKDEDVSWHGM